MKRDIRITVEVNGTDTFTETPSVEFRVIEQRGYRIEDSSYVCRIYTTTVEVSCTGFV